MLLRLFWTPFDETAVYTYAENYLRRVNTPNRPGTMAPVARPLEY